MVTSLGLIVFLGEVSNLMGKVVVHPKIPFVKRQSSFSSRFWCTFDILRNCLVILCLTEIRTHELHASEPWARWVRGIRRGKGGVSVLSGVSSNEGEESLRAAPVRDEQ